MKCGGWIHWAGLAFRGWCFWVLTLGFAFHCVASKLCFRDKFRLEWRFWWMGVCSERVEIIANFAEATKIWYCYCYFSWQAQYAVRALSCGSAIFVLGAGNREVVRCGGGHNSWQAQYFVRVWGVDALIFVAGAGNREVASCGGGECRCDIWIGVCLEGLK